MGQKKPDARAPKRATAESVESFLEKLDHPHKPAIESLRQLILAADPSIGEEIKWNAPSFYTREHFATFQLRARGGIQLVLHLGAKTRDTATTGIAIDDPEGLLQWLAKDRASATFRDLADVQARGAAFTALLRQWIAYV